MTLSAVADSLALGAEWLNKENERHVEYLIGNLDKIILTKILSHHGRSILSVMI
jgi:hypothetical protein